MVCGVLLIMSTCMGLNALRLGFSTEVLFIYTSNLYMYIILTLTFVASA